MSSQSFALVKEYEIAVMGGNLREASGMDSEEAYLASAPEFGQYLCYSDDKAELTLRHLKRP
jgi:hypothetical protein